MKILQWIDGRNSKPSIRENWKAGRPKSNSARIQQDKMKNISRDLWQITGKSEGHMGKIMPHIIPPKYILKESEYS